MCPPVPFQESLWKFKQTAAASTAARGPALKIIVLFLLLLTFLFLDPQSTTMVFHLSFLDLLLVPHSTGRTRSRLLPTWIQGWYYISLSVSYSFYHFSTPVVIICCEMSLLA
ncbi:hypothetical protein I3842_10G144100 [Carya illinoinensis]|uniref:Uncharacterized protein n=1 Tax=Carya illinoinensis TaxID=32201 RepID=A0A922DY51_CARIL|nr:hypothetical protein I3842_10G144100 [Carya illinoinensis]